MSYIRIEPFKTPKEELEILKKRCEYEKTLVNAFRRQMLFFEKELCNSEKQVSSYEDKIKKLEEELEKI